MKLADKGLNMQALALEEAQSKIRIAVRDGWMRGLSKAAINEQIQRIIREALKEVTTPALRDAAYRSLNAFAERQYNTYLTAFGFDSRLFLAVIALYNGNNSIRPRTAVEKELHIGQQSTGVTYATDAKGVPTQVYAEEYFTQRVKPVFEELVRQKALDPDDVSGRNTLRNRAEMEVRYDNHLTQIGQLRAAGVKLVAASVHADCSDRCYKWQGRVYSLDGTTGTTPDGKSYVPLEHATDIYYTTKAGKTYKNGLLGFNCRHYLMPYKEGMIIPHVSREERKREYTINTKQRELERIVRYYESVAAQNKGVDNELNLRAKRLAKEWRREYVKFSYDNDRAYYPSRIKFI
ncbi:MAG: hypothetical protein HFK08_08440 [Clostridia bacterium]|nr:hypothetical protein [Clostridia bacterium]